MKKQILALAVSGLFTLSFLGILAMGGESAYTKEMMANPGQEEVLEANQEAAPGGDEAGAPGSEEDFRKITDAEKFPFHARLFQDDGRLILGLEGRGESQVEINIYDLSGKKVFTHSEKVISGENHFMLSMRHAVPGIYFVRASMQGMSRTLKISKTGLPS